MVLYSQCCQDFPPFSSPAVYETVAGVTGTPLDELSYAKLETAGGRPNMNNETNGEENRTQENWLSSVARIYGTWHLAITAMQSAAWAAFVYWNASGESVAWADAVQAVGEKSWPAIPAFFITSAMVLAAIQKGGRMVLTFMDERRKRIEKARAEARAEGIGEGRVEGRVEAYAEWTEWNRRREDAEKRGERFDEPPPSINGR